MQLLTVQAVMVYAMDKLLLHQLVEQLLILFLGAMGQRQILQLACAPGFTQ